MDPEEPDEPEVEPGWVDVELRAEFPELRLWQTEVAATPARSSEGLRERLRHLSDGFRGPQAVMLRQQPVPHAYRVFFRHIGLDPDEDRTPVEALALERLKAGAFKSKNSLDDALTVATLETNVALWALDAERLEGRLGIRVARPGEVLGRTDEAPRVPEGRLVVVDDPGPVAVLFGDLAPGHGVTYETSRIRLFAVAVAGVPGIHVEEALWTCGEILLDEAGVGR